MEDRIDNAMKVKNLRSKLHAIEAKRAVCSKPVCKIKGIFARIKYPKTLEGRKRFIKDSLKPKGRNNIESLCYLILTASSLAGTIFIIYKAFKLDDISLFGMVLAFAAFCLCLTGLFKGIQGLLNRRDDNEA